MSAGCPEPPVVPPSIHRPGVPAAVVHNPPRERRRLAHTRTGCPHHAQLTRTKTQGRRAGRHPLGSRRAERRAPGPAAAGCPRHEAPFRGHRLRCDRRIGAGQHENPGRSSRIPAPTRRTALMPGRHGSPGQLAPFRPRTGSPARRSRKSTPGGPDICSDTQKPTSASPTPHSSDRHASSRPTAREPALQRGAAGNSRPAARIPTPTRRRAGGAGGTAANRPARARPPANPAHRRGAARNPRPAPGYLLRHAGAPGAPVAQQRTGPLAPYPPENPAHRRGAARNPAPSTRIPTPTRRRAGGRRLGGDPASSRLATRSAAPGCPRHGAPWRLPSSCGCPTATRRRRSTNPGSAPGYLLRQQNRPPGRHSSEPARSRLSAREPGPPARRQHETQAQHPDTYSDTQARQGGTAAIPRPTRAIPPANPAHRRGAARKSRPTTRRATPTRRTAPRPPGRHGSDPSQLAPFRPRTGAPARRSR